MDRSTVLAIAALLVGALATYLGVVRRLSGRIKTTDASKLWDEATAMRREYREEIERMQKVINSLTTRLDEVEVVNGDLHLKNGELKKKLETQEREIEALKIQVGDLESHNQDLTKENRVLKARVSELENHG